MKLNHFTLLTVFFCFLKINTTIAQPSRFTFNKFNIGSDTLNYRMLVPDYSSIKYPLIIFLHGSGERGNDNEAQLKWGVSNFASDDMMTHHAAIVVAPQCPSDSSWSNFTRDNTTRTLILKPEPTKPMALLRALIEKLVKENAIDTNRIYITGLSMGGYGTFDAISRYPNLFAAAVPVCGGGDISKAPELAKLPIWIFHGTDDKAVNPLFSIDMVNALFKVGGHPGFTLYPNVGHFSWLGAYRDSLMLEWLFKQHK